MINPLRDFLRAEASGGVLLVGAALVALVWANSPWSASYDELWHSVISLEVAGHALTLDLRHWVNDGLMTLFFLIVGLEIKREMTTGHLAARRDAALPIAAAIGGMAVPAVLYLAIAGRTDAGGWGVPMATDIALAVGVLAIAGPHVPSKLRAFLLGLAVVDDVGAIVVIALFYSSGVSFAWLAIAGAALTLTLIARHSGLSWLILYVALGVVLWFALHEAGVHPTMAGVLMGLLAPARPHTPPELVDAEELGDLSTVEHARSTVQLARRSVSTVEWLEHLLHPWTSYLIVPVFALANSGIEVSVDSLTSALDSPVTWGVFVGLVLGKPLGVLVATEIARRGGIADRPDGTTTGQLLGVGNAAGIGFTVSIFIAELAFDTADAQTDAKMAILAASLVSGVLAFVVLRRGRSAATAQRLEPTKLS